MPDICLGSDISFCVIDGGATFLDIRHDRYFGMSARANRAFINLCETGFVDRDGLGGLFRGGVLIEGKGGAPLVPTPDRSATRGLPLRHSDPAFVRALPSIGWHLIKVRRHLRRGAFGPLIDRVRAGRSSGACGNADVRQLASLIATFSAARQLVPITPNCLLDSLALLSWLGQWRQVPDLIFGVRRDPFAAHCWLQAGDIVLNDALDNVTAFRPILIA